MVHNADPQGAARTTLTDDASDDGHPQGKHFPQIGRNSLPLSLFFRLEACISSGGVDEHEQGQVETVPMAHESQSLAVPPRGRHAEVAGHFFLGIPPLLMAHQQQRDSIDGADTAHQCGIVVATAVPMEFIPGVAQGFDVVEGVGTLGMAGHLDHLGRGEVGVDLLPPLGHQLFQLLHLLTHVQITVFRVEANLLDFGLQIRQRPLEIQDMLT